MQKLKAYNYWTTCTTVKQANYDENIFFTIYKDHKHLTNKNTMVWDTTVKHRLLHQGNF